MGTFILQRFYYSLASGFIINLFIIINFYVLDKKDYLPRYFRFIKDISMPEMLTVTIFIITVIMVGIFIERFNETCFQYYKKLYDEKKHLYLKEENRKKKEEHLLPSCYGTFSGELASWKHVRHLLIKA